VFDNLRNFSILCYFITYELYLSLTSSDESESVLSKAGKVPSSIASI
jgi:hypothetical protein